MNTPVTDEIIPAISGGFGAQRDVLVVPDRKIPFQKWAEVGAKLRDIQGATRWWIGDWLAYGERWYGEDIHQVMDMWNDYSQASLSNMKYTSVAFPPFRRRKSISWSNHAELRTRPIQEQEQYLDELEMGMTRTELRLALNGDKPPRPHCKSCTCYE